MKTKKFMSLVLALAMALSLAVPAFASGTGMEVTEVTDMAKIDTATTTVSGSYQAPVLALTVPKKINLLFNPYGVAVKTNENTAIEQTGVQRQIVSADNLIISRSNVPIDIKVQATGTITSAEGEANAWTLSKTALQSSSTKKEALVYMVFGTVDTDAIDTEAEVTAFMKTSKSGNDVPYNGLHFTDITYAAGVTPTTITGVEAPADATTKKDGVIIQAGEGKQAWLNQKLGECSVTETTNNGTTTYAYNSVSAVAFKFDGAMIANPKDTSWGKDDKLTVSVAWKFVPDTQATTNANSQTQTPDATVAAANYKVDKSEAAVPTKDISGESAFSDKNGTTPNFQLTAQTVDVGATISTAGVVSFNKTKVDAIITAGKDDGNGGTIAYVANDKIETIITVTYTDNATTPATQTKHIKLEITLTAA